MRKNEVKRTVEEVVRVEYIAEDGTVFYDETEARKYEESALFAISKNLKKLNIKRTSHYDLLETYEESELEIFNVETQEDLDNLRRYLYLKALHNGSSESNIKSAFTSEDGTRSKYVFDSVTTGHEVLIFWSYDGDWFWVYNDGSLNGYFEWVKENYLKIITPPVETEVQK